MHQVLREMDPGKGTEEQEPEEEQGQTRDEERGDEEQGTADDGVELPTGWSTERLLESFADGFHPYIRTTRGVQYVTLKKGSKESSLGRHSDAKWQMVVDLYNGVSYGRSSNREEHEATEETGTEDVEDAKEDLVEDDERNVITVGEAQDALQDFMRDREPLRRTTTVRTSQNKVMGSKVSRPLVIPSTYHPDLDTLYFYRLMQEHGYSKPFEDFVNETVKAYFATKGFMPGLVLTMVKEQ